MRPLSEIAGPELNEAIAELLPDHIPSDKPLSEVLGFRPVVHGLRLVGLSNCHVPGKLLCDQLPPTAVIPWRYEGFWERPLPELAKEPTRTEPAFEDGGILEEFSRCTLIYA